MRLVFQKHPDAVLDYVIDWTDWLESGDVISSAVWSVPAGLTQPFTSSLSGAASKVWVAGGTDGSDYRIDCHITTTGGRQDVRSFTLKVRA